MGDLLEVLASAVFWGLDAPIPRRRLTPLAAFTLVLVPPLAAALGLWLFGPPFDAWAVALVLAVPFLGSFFAAIQVGRGWVEASLLAVGSSLLTLFWWGVFTLVWVFLTIFNTFF